MKRLRRKIVVPIGGEGEDGRRGEELGEQSEVEGSDGDVVVEEWMLDVGNMSGDEDPEGQVTRTRGGRGVTRPRDK